MIICMLDFFLIFVIYNKRVLINERNYEYEIKTTN